MIVVFLIPLAILLVYFMVNKLVRQPVENSRKAKRFAEGDTSVYVDIKTRTRSEYSGKHSIIWWEASHVSKKLKKR